MAKLLVTGGAGFIGANFVKFWRGRYDQDELCVLDSLTYAGNRASLSAQEMDPGFTFIHGDIRDYDVVARILRDREIDTIVHFAAETHVDRSIHGPDAFIDTNVNGTHTLLKAAKFAWLDQGTGRPHRFHHVSTDEVYGTLGPYDPAFTEHTAYAPNSPYSASKAASDHLVRAYHHTFSLAVTTTNCSNNYGPYQFPEKLIPLFLINALHGRELPIYGDGQQVRDWLYVDDHCLGISRVLAEGRVGEVYNIGGNTELPNLQVINQLCEHLDSAIGGDAELAARFPDSPAARGAPTSSLKTYVKDRPGHDRRYAIDTSKITTELGYRPAHDFGSGFAATLKWYLENESWWRGVLDGSYREWTRQQYGE